MLINLWVESPHARASFPTILCHPSRYLSILTSVSQCSIYRGGDNPPLAPLNPPSDKSQVFIDPQNSQK